MGLTWGQREAGVGEERVRGGARQHAKHVAELDSPVCTCTHVMKSASTSAWIRLARSSVPSLPNTTPNLDERVATDKLATAPAPTTGLMRIPTTLVDGASAMMLRTRSSSGDVCGGDEFEGGGRFVPRAYYHVNQGRGCGYI